MTKLDKQIKKLELLTLRIEDVKDALSWESITDIATRLAMLQGELAIVGDNLKEIKENK